MATNVQRKLFEKDLRSLEELVQLLHTEIDDKIRKILIQGKNWLSQDVRVEKQSFQVIKHTTESAISLVTEICQQIGGDWDERAQRKVSGSPETMKSNKLSRASGQLMSILLTTLWGAKSLTAHMKAVEEKVASLSQTVDTLRSRQDLTESDTDNISSRFSQLEDDVKVKSDHIDNTIQEMTTDMRRVQTGLEQTRTNVQDLEDRENVTKRNIDRMTRTIKSHTSKLTALGKKRVSPVVSFTAEFPSHYKPARDITVTGYGKVGGNKDGSFCKDTGIFTAPVKGLYGACVKQWQCDSGAVEMCIIKSSPSCSSRTGVAAAVTSQRVSEERICWTMTRGDKEHDISLVATEMEVGDTLRVVPAYMTQNPSLYDASTFSVFLITS